jgi:ABC-type branched-subunit amino acid transport system ATPase component
MSKIGTKNLSKHFDGVKAIDNLSINFGSGEVTALVGPNGSGKTTLVNLLSGVAGFDSGHVLIDGVAFSQITPHDIASLGMTRTFQAVRLFEQITVLDNILVVLTERGVLASLFERHKAYHVEKAREVLEFVGLWEKRDEKVEGLSYGQRKLLEIARVLAMNSEIILLDEPFAGLFPEMVKKVRDAIIELRAKGKTIILVEHNMQLIRELADQVYVLDAGKLLAQGKPGAVLSERKVIEAYLGE